LQPGYSEPREILLGTIVQGISAAPSL